MPKIGELNCGGRIRVSITSDLFWEELLFIIFATVSRLSLTAIRDGLSERIMLPLCVAY